MMTIIFYSGNSEHLNDAFTGLDQVDVGSIALAFYYTKMAYGGW